MTEDGGEIEMWGDGEQTRSFLYVDECIEATLRLTRSNWTGPVNIGSDEMVSINHLAHMIMGIANKNLTIKQQLFLRFFEMIQGDLEPHIY